MIEIARGRWPVAIRTLYFAGPGDALDPGGADLVGLVQCTLPREGLSPFRTLHIDLRHEADRLFAGINASTRNQIHRALRDDALTFVARRRPDDVDLRAFQAFYNDFARIKGTARCGAYHLQTLRLLARQGGLVVTQATGGDDQPLCVHVYVVDGTRAMLLYTGSHFRNAVATGDRRRFARANRALHWRDVLLFKETGLATYDCGGLTDDAQVAEFKRSFGGRDVTEYSGYVPVTWTGRAALYCRTLLSRVSRPTRGRLARTPIREPVP